MSRPMFWRLEATYAGTPRRQHHLLLDVEGDMHHLTPQQMGKLVCDLFDEGITLAGDVPQALIRRFA